MSHDMPENLNEDTPLAMYKRDLNGLDEGLANLRGENWRSKLGIVMEKVLGVGPVGPKLREFLIPELESERAIIVKKIEELEVK